MSLLLNASPWTSTNDVSKKRIPTIKKPSFLEDNLNKEKEHSSVNNSNENNIEGYTLYKNNTLHPTNTTHTSSTINHDIMGQETKNNKINQLIENMSNLNIQNDGDSLFNYNTDITTETPFDTVNRAVPIFQRNIESNTETNGIETNNIIGNGILGDTNTIQRGRGGGIPSNYEFNTPNNLANLVNYSKAYEVPRETRPYYTHKMGIGNSNDSFEEKIMDKIQYLTHLMEEIQSEKTANITEEFVLYTMLGVFVIYVVDAFSKSGKYIR